MPEFTYEGYEAHRKTVTKAGNGVHVFVPKGWCGDEVAVIRLSDRDPDADTEYPWDAQ